MINPSIQRILMGKTESEAIHILNSYNCEYLIHQDQGGMIGVPKDRNDYRYNVIIGFSGKVIRVFGG